MADRFLVKVYLWVLFFFNKYDNPQIAYQKLVKIYQWSKVLLNGVTRHMLHSRI